MSLLRSLFTVAALGVAGSAAAAQPVQAPNPISVHVLDLQTGQPSADMVVILERRRDGQWVRLGTAHTDADGRVQALYPEGVPLENADYRLTFETGAWFQSRHIPSLYPVVQVQMQVDGSASHYHVPLLLSPYGYSTYRGS